MKKILRSFFIFCFFLFYIIGIYVMISYFSSFMELGWRKALSIIIFSPRTFIFIILITSFVIGTILICENKKSLFANQLQRFGIEKTSIKYKFVKDFLTVFLTISIILFYVGDMFAILISSYLLFDEIKEMYNPNPLPSSLNISIQSIVRDLIMSIVPFIFITSALIIKRRKNQSK